MARKTPILAGCLGEASDEDGTDSETDDDSLNFGLLSKSISLQSL